MNQEQATKNLSKIQGMVDLAAAVKSADIVIEAVVENWILRTGV